MSRYESREDETAAGLLGARWNQMRREGWRAVAFQLPPGQKFYELEMVGPLTGAKAQQLADRGVMLVRGASMERNAEYTIWQHPQNKRWFVASPGLGGAATSARGYATAEEAERSAEELAFTRGDRRPDISLEEQTPNTDRPYTYQSEEFARRRNLPGAEVRFVAPDTWIITAYGIELGSKTKITKRGKVRDVLYVLPSLERYDAMRALPVHRPNASDPPPPPRRRRTADPSLRRVRQIVEREERPFEPERRYPRETKPHHFVVNASLEQWREPDDYNEWLAIWYGPGGRDEAEQATKIEQEGGRRGWVVSEYQHLEGYVDDFDPDEPFLVTETVVDRQETLDALAEAGLSEPEDELEIMRYAVAFGVAYLAERGGEESFDSELP